MFYITQKEFVNYQINWQRNPNFSMFFRDLPSKSVQNTEENVAEVPTIKNFLPPSGEVSEKRLKAASAWKNMMKGPPTAPLCKGHNETCALRTVKKKGANLNRQFWCCARGEGRSDDPNARCDFFKWLK